jgi:uncharacterized protein YukE
MAENIKDLQKEIDSLKKSIKNLGGETFSDMNAAIQAFGGGVEGAKKLITNMKEDVTKLQDTFGNISSTLKNIVNDLRGAPNPVKETTKSFDKLESLARRINEHKKGEEVLTIKQLKNTEKQTRAEIERLKELEKTLDKQSDAYKEINDALNKETGFLKDIVSLTKQEVEAEQKLQKTLGITGAMFNGITKSLEKIGIESEHFENIKKDLREAAKSGDGFKVIGAGLKSMVGGIKEALTDPLVQLTLVAKTFQTLYKIGIGFSKDQADISRTLGVSSDRAGEMANNMRSMARNSGDLFANAKDNLTAFKELNDAFGTSVEFNQKQLATQTKLKEAAGLTADEAAKLAEYEQITGKSSEDIYNNIGKTNKGVLSQKKITQEVLKVSGQLAAQYKNNPDLIAKAVTQAQKLGMTLEQTKNISKGLLNFEDSISAELEAELLTGQDLNLEKARGLALQGDTAGAAAELMKNLGPNGLQRFQKMNVLQQESYAKALGMSADELGDSLRKQDALQKLEKGRGKGITEQIKKLEAAGETEKAAELQRRVTQGETVELAMQRLDAEAELTKNVEKTKDSLTSMIAGPLGSIVGMATSLLGMIQKIPGLGTILGIIGAGAAIGALIVGVGLLVKTVKGAFGKGPADKTAKNTERTADAVEKIANSGGSIDGTGGLSGGRGKKGKRGRKGKRRGKGAALASAAFGMMEAADSDAMSDMIGGGADAVDAISEITSSSTPSSSPKPSAPKIGSAPAAAASESKGLMGAASKSKGLFGKIGGFFGGIGKKISGGLGGFKKILGGPIAKGFGKILGPILSIVEGVSSAASIISEAREKKASGEKVDPGALGKSLVQSAAYPIANLGINAIPGIGTAISIADGIAGSLGFSPIKWITDNLVDLVPNDAFSGLGNLALGDSSEKAMAKGGIVTGPTRALVGEAGPEAVIPLNQLMNEFKEMKQILSAILHKEGTITLNGTKMGTAMAVGSYKVQ